MVDTNEYIFNHALADVIETAKKNNVSISHIVGILAAAQFKLLSQIEQRK